jgi:hypothetical protein
MCGETRHSVVAEAAPFLSQAGRPSWRKPLVGAGAALLLLAWHEATGAFACFSNAGDEWMEVNKVIAVARGHRLYREIWNDQPPLYTLALSGLAHGGETDMEWFRRATFVFAGTLLVAVCGVGAVWGLSLGELACAAGFLTASPLFLPSSASITLEIPALSLGVMGAWLLLAAVGRRSWLLAALGGCVLGVAAMTKLTALSVVPVVGGLATVGLLAFGGRQSWQVLGVALLAFVATTAAVWHVCSDGAPWRHLLGTHFTTYPLLDAEARAAYRFRWDWFSWQPLFSMAAVGGLLCLVRSPRRWTAVVLGLWVAAVAWVFAVHFPWWNYYSLHLCVPLALLAGVGLWQAIRWSVTARPGAWLQTGGRLLAAAFAVACVWGWGEAFAAEMRRVRTVGRWQDNPIVRCVREQSSMDRSHPLIMLQLVPGPYAVYCGLKPLPWYAVLPKKRYWVGELDNVELAAQIRAQTAQVLFASRLDLSPMVLAEAIEAHYRQICASEEVSVWVPRTK